MESRWQSRLNLRYPVIQAGMGGGISGADLAVAVSTAGGLGTIGLMPPQAFRAELRTARQRSAGRPFAANLLMPFVREAHVEACLSEQPDVVSLFFGFNRSLVNRLKAAGVVVLHQVGTAEQAKRAAEDGADGLIAQGDEAGGHLAGSTRLAEFLPIIRQMVGHDYPVFAAGGIHDAASARRAIAFGADGIVSGTRFLLTPESNAHPEYQARLLAATETLRTRLFGLGWPAPHRVVANAATVRWCGGGHPDGPAWVTTVNTLAIPSRYVLPLDTVTKLVPIQRASIPLYSPIPITRDMDPRHLDVTPLYAGQCVREIKQLRSAADVVAELAAGCRS